MEWCQSLSLPWMFFFPVSFIPSSESLSLLSHCNTATFLSNILFWGRNKISFSICSSFQTVFSEAIKDTNLRYSLLAPLSNSFHYFHNTIYSFIKCLLYLIQRGCHDDIRDRQVNTSPNYRMSSFFLLRSIVIF